MSKELTVEAAKIATPSNHSKRASVTRKRKDIDSLHASDAPPTKRQKNAVSTRTAAPSPPRDEAPNYPASIILEKEPGLLSDLRTLLRQLKPVLVQESVRDDPWKLLLAARLLNVTAGRMAIPVFWRIVARWPTPSDLLAAPIEDLVELIRPLGIHNKRAQWVVQMSERYINDPPRYIPSPDRHSSSSRSPYPLTPVSHFSGVGPYALDSFRLFSRNEYMPDDEWMTVMPQDKELIRYLRWKWAYEEGKIWYPRGVGVVGDVDVAYLVTLVDELAEHYDTAIGGEGYIQRFIDDVTSSK